MDRAQSPELLHGRRCGHRTVRLYVRFADTSDSRLGTDAAV